MLQAKRAAFTLVEVIVCIFIIVILIGLFLPRVRNIREAANRVAAWSSWLLPLLANEVVMKIGEKSMPIC